MGSVVMIDGKPLQTSARRNLKNAQYLAYQGMKIAEFPSGRRAEDSPVVSRLTCKRFERFMSFKAAPARIVKWSMSPADTGVFNLQSIVRIKRRLQSAIAPPGASPILRKVSSMSHKPDPSPISRLDPPHATCCAEEPP
jgi:hypothetical protein